MDSSSATPNAGLRLLRDRNTDDLLAAAGLVGWARRVPALRRLFDGPSSHLAGRLLAFDDAFGRGVGAAAATDLLAGWGIGVVATGVAPSSGPRLFVSNHPGLGDVLALLSVLPSDGLKIVARDRPFLRALPHLAESLFLIPEVNSWGVLKQVSSHLAQGGAVLTFPAGRIEPDPAWAPRADWTSWSQSTALWARTVPGLVVQPLLVAGVRARGFVDPWFARWRRKSADRDWTAAVGQLVGQVLWGRPRSQRIEVAWGRPLDGGLWKTGEGSDELVRQLERLHSLVSRTDLNRR